MSEQKNRYYDFGEFRLDAKRRNLTKKDEKIPLSGRIFDLLLVLLESNGEILEHDELLRRVWGETFVEQANLKKGISSLRQVLGEKPNESLYIKTIPRRGYCFVAEVTTAQDDSEIFFADDFSQKAETVEKTEEPKPSSEENKEVEIVKEEIVSSIPKTENSTSFYRKYKLPVFAAVSLTLIGALFFGFKQFGAGNAATDKFRLENLKVQKMTTSGNIVESTISPDGKTIVYSTIGANKQQTLWAKRIGAPNALQVVPASGAEYYALSVSPDNNYIFYVAEMDDAPVSLYKISMLGGTPRKLTEKISSAVSFSPDGKRIIFVRDPDNTSRVLISANAEDGGDEKEIRKVSDNHTMIAPIWSPDGKKIAFVSSQPTEKGRIWTVVEIPAEGGEPREIVASRKGKIHIFDWTRDGGGLVICADPNDSMQSQVWYSAYPNGEMTRLTNDIQTYQGINLSADGNSVLTIQRERTGDLFYLNSSLSPDDERLTDSQTFMGRFAVASDNRILAESNENGRRGLAFINADGTNFQPLFPNANNEQSPVISNDGKNIYFVSTRSGTAEIWQTDIEGRNAKQLTDEKTFIIVPKPAPDGKFIYFQIYDNIRWRLARIPTSGGKPEFVIEETIGAFDFSPDGNFLAYSFFDAPNKKWKITVKKLVDNMTVNDFDAAAIDFIGWTPDSKNLLYTLPEIPREGGSLWLQPIDGNPSKLLLDGKQDKVLWADWSNDGQRLYFTKGKTVANLVLISSEAQN